MDGTGERKTHAFYLPAPQNASPDDACMTGKERRADGCFLFPVFLRMRKYFSNSSSFREEASLSGRIENGERKIFLLLSFSLPFSTTRAFTHRHDAFLKKEVRNRG